MTRNDTATRHVTTLIVLAFALFAAGDSYSHIYDLARLHQQNAVSTALLPLAADGVIAAASAVMLVASRQGHPVPFRARLLLFAGIAATAAANMAYGVTAALLSVWPVAAYVGCMELLTWMRQHTGMQPKTTRTASVAAPADAPADAAPDELATRRRGVRRPARDLSAAAVKAFPEAHAGNVPSLRVIQTTMQIGQPRAQAVQRFFGELQAVLARTAASAPAGQQQDARWLVGVRSPGHWPARLETLRPQ